MTVRIVESHLIITYKLKIITILRETQQSDLIATGERGRERGGLVVGGTELLNDDNCTHLNRLPLFN